MAKIKKTCVQEERQEEKLLALADALSVCDFIADSSRPFLKYCAQTLISILEKRGFVLMRKPKGKQ